MRVGLLALVDRLLARLVGSVLARALRLSGRRIGLALVYHRVETGNREAGRTLIPAIEEDVLAAQLRLLRAHHEVVPPSLLLRAVRKRRRGERFPVAITFDDDLPTHPTAAGLLKQLGLPAGFFLSGASLATPFRFWWELLEAAARHGVESLPEVTLGRSVEDEPTLAEVAEEISAMSPHERDAVSDRLRGVTGPDPEDSGLRADEVQALAAAGFEIGFHTLRHDAMPPLDDEGLMRALTEGRDPLSAAVGREPTMLAYPHGEADRRVAGAARAAGYELGFTGEPEPVTASSDPLLLGRLDVALRTPLEFVLVLIRILLR